jgi:hypothetical protein
MLYFDRKKYFVPKQKDVEHRSTFEERPRSSVNDEQLMSDWANAREESKWERN